MPARDAFFVRLRVAPRTQPGQTTAGLGFKITYDTFGTSTGHCPAKHSKISLSKILAINFLKKYCIFEELPTVAPTTSTTPTPLPTPPDAAPRPSIHVYVGGMQPQAVSF
jgi:hypothetical protein